MSICRWSGHRWLGMVTACALCIAGWLIPDRVGAEDDPLMIHQTQVKAISIHRQTQQHEDQWVAERTTLEKRYHALSAEEKQLARQQAALEAQVAALQARADEADRKISETARIGEELHAYLYQVVARLEETIARDLPFLPDERARRMTDLKNALVQPDTGIAERYRRVMEAVKVETEYGGTVEVYPAAIEVGFPEGDRRIMADVLRVGRLALFWRSPDGNAVGHWDRVAAAWTTLPDRYRRSINDATEMALKRRTIDMVNLPLGRIEPL